MEKVLDQKMYTISEALTVLGLGRTSLYQEISRGRLVARKYGKRTLISAPDLQKWIDSLPTFKKQGV